MGKDKGSSRLGNDGISIMVNKDRALRAREVSQPSDADRRAAEGNVPELIARARGRRKG